MLIIIMLCEYLNAECHYAECHYVECHNTECRCAESHCDVKVIVKLEIL